MIPDAEIPPHTPLPGHLHAGPAVSRPAPPAAAPAVPVPLAPPASPRAYGGAAPSAPAALPFAPEPAAAAWPAAAPLTEPVPPPPPPVTSAADLAWLDTLDWGMDDDPAPAATVTDEPAPAAARVAEPAPAEPVIPGDAVEGEAEEDVPGWMAWTEEAGADAAEGDPGPVAAAEAPAADGFAGPDGVDDDLPITDIEALLEDDDDGAHWIGALPEHEAASASEDVPGPEDGFDGAVGAGVTEEEPAAAADAEGWRIDDEVEPWTTAADEGEPALPASAAAPSEDAPGGVTDAPAEQAEAIVTAAAAEVLVAEAGGAAEIAEAASDALGEVADRLERIAASLRSRSSADLLSGADSRDPLELLLTGFVLGYASRSNAAPKADREA